MKIFVFLATFIISYLLTPRLIRLSSRLSLVYTRKKGTLRSRTGPLMGGISIFISFTVVTALAFILSRGTMLGEYDFHYLGIVIGGSLMVVLGAYDDARKSSLSFKLLVQILAVLCLIACGYRIRVLTWVFGGQIELGWWGVPILIAWLLATTNSLALIDKVDGLACGIAGIAALTLFLAGLQGPPFVPVLALALTAACAGFLRYNYYPARIFPGSSGTMFLGFVLGALSVQGSFKITAGITLLLPLLALLTALFNYFRRGDRHPQLHQRLLDLGYSPRQVVLMLYIVQVNLRAIALVMAYSDKFFSLLIFLLVGVMLYLLFKITEEFRRLILGNPRE